MDVNFNKREPIYIQVVRYFKEQLATGQLAPGEEIPSRRELASDLKINPNTVQRAYKEMEDAGLIYTDSNQPSKIINNQAIVDQVREELVLQAVDGFIQSMQKIAMPKQEVLRMINENYDEEHTL